MNQLLNNLDVKGAIELIAALTVFFGAMGAMFFVRGGVGPRIVQLAGAVMILPIVLILALEKTLEPAVLGVVIGAVIGYLLSGVSEMVIRSETEKEPQP